jgi:hypothetical protein
MAYFKRKDRFLVVKLIRFLKGPAGPPRLFTDFASASEGETAANPSGVYRREKGRACEWGCTNDESYVQSDLTVVAGIVTLRMIKKKKKKGVSVNHVISALCGMVGLSF